MSYRSSSCVVLAVFVLGMLAALPQADAAITLTDSGSVWTNNADDTPISNPLTVSTSANVLVVDLSWRTNVGTTPTNPPVVTYAGIPLTAGASLCRHSIRPQVQTGRKRQSTTCSCRRRDPPTS